MKKFIIFIILMMQAQAWSFTSFTVSPELLERAKLLDKPKLTQDEKSQLQTNDAGLKQALNIETLALANEGLSKALVLSALRDKTIPGNSQNDFFAQTPMYQEILNELGPKYQTVGEQQSLSTLNYNRQFNLGQKNFSGFQWQKPMGNFGISVDRQLAPHLFNDTQWVVTDTFLITISAQTFLSNLKNAGQIDYTQAQFGAFAGMEFRRMYRYMHIANSFEEGLTKKFDILFLGFTKLNHKNFVKMGPNEYIMREDYIGAKIGGMAYIPISQGLSANLGLLVNYEKISRLTIQSLGEGDVLNSPDEKFRLSLEKETSKTVGVQAALNADLFSLIKITLLSYEYSYTWRDATKFYVSLKNADLEKIPTDQKLAQGLDDFFRLKESSRENLKPYVVSFERRTTEDSQSKYLVVLFGGIKKSETEQLTIQKDDLVRTFFRTHLTQVKFSQGLFQTLLNAVSEAFLQVKLFNKYKSSRTRELNFEYENNFKMSEQEILLNGAEQLSLVISHEFTAAKTTGRWNSKYKGYAVHFANNFTNLDVSIIDGINNKKIQGPISISTNSQINKEGIYFFNQKSYKDVSHFMARLCNYTPSNTRFQNPKTTSRAYTDQKSCYNSLDLKYTSYLKNLKGQNKIALWKLKSFLKSILEMSDSNDDLRELFGEGHVFTRGEVRAKTNQGHDFITYFHNGTFSGLGVIDDFKRDVAQRAPAAIPVESEL